MSDPTPSEAPLRVAYLCGMYPAVSLTFILREIEALRARGVEVLPCSIRRTPPSQHPGPLERAHAAETFNTLPELARPGRSLAALGWALTRSRRFGRMLGLAWRLRAPGLRAFVYQIIYAAEAIVLARHLVQSGATHIHNHFISSSATVAVLAARLAGLPFSFTLHGPTDFYEPFHWKLDEKTAQAAFVACISHYARAQGMNFSDPAHWDRLEIVRCGVSPDLYAAPPEARAAGGPVELLFVGRLARVKGLLVLFEALRCMESVPPVRVTLIGDGPERALLERAAADLGDRVRFLGYRSQAEVAEELRRTDAFVLPSFAEGVPVVLMEALAAGVPVIATRVAGMSELVEDGVSGQLVPPGDAESLARAIAGMAELDPTMRARMGRAGRDCVRAEFDITKAAARLEELLRAGDARRTGSTS